MKVSIDPTEAPPDTERFPRASERSWRALDVLRGAGRWLARDWGAWAFLPVVVLSALAHGINLFHYPYYHTDEGTYVAQAWAILRRGELAHYTYWYDHAPFGWIQIAAWAVLTHGFSTFGTPIDSGRVLMLLFQCWSVYLVFQIARTISGSALTAALAALLFGLSAYGIYYHRRVLLDNVTTPWMLLSILAIVRSPLALTRVWLSAVALAASILSKELTVFLVPALAAYVFFRSARPQRLFATMSWLFLVGAIVSSYPLMAILKNEMFPTGTFLGGNEEHVSLIGSLQLQAARGKDAGLLGLESSFWRETMTWATHEPLLAIGGSLGALVSILTIRRFPLYGLLGLATLSLWLFLARGGIILGFYYVPLLPLLALNVALPVGWFLQWAPAAVGRLLARERFPLLVRATTRSISVVLAMLCLVPLARGYSSGAIGLERDSFGLWTITQTTGQREAVDWIRRYLHPDSAILVDDEVWVSLREPRPGQPVFNHAHWYIKLDGDPEIRHGVFKNDAGNVDYILNTQDVFDRTREPDVPLARAVVDGSTPIAAFDSGRYPVEIRRVNRLNQWRAASDPMLVRSWIAFKGTYVRGGRVVDPATGVTTAETQASAMLRSVYMDDRASFDDLWSWARTRLQVRGDGLLVSRYGPDASGAEDVLDRATSSAADQDVALALLFAAHQWRQAAYQQQALDILQGIWRTETVQVAGSRVVVAGDWARGGPNADAIVSPSSFAPYAYRIFAAVDPRQPWASTIDSSYALLAKVQHDPALGARAGLVPNLVALDPKSGAVRPASGLGPQAERFSVEASKLPLRLGLDLLWNAEPRADDVLTRLSLPRQELQTRGWLAGAYDLEGKPAAQTESLAMYAGVLPSLLFQGNDALAHLIFADKIVRPTLGGGLDPTSPGAFSLEDQSASWLATALMHGGLANLWKEQETIDWPTILDLPMVARSGPPGEMTRAALAAGSAQSTIVARAAGSVHPAGASPAPGFAPTTTEVIAHRPAPAPALASAPGEFVPGQLAARNPASARPVLVPSTMPSSSAQAASSRPASSSVIVPGAVAAPASAGPATTGATPRVTAAQPGRSATPIFAPSRPAAPRTAAPPLPTDEYVIRAGENLSEIAERHGTDVDALAALNGLDDPDAIVAGASILVPAPMFADGATFGADGP